MQKVHIIDTGVKKLKNFGFINVTSENVLVDEVYCFFFLRFITSLKGKSTDLDKQIESVLQTIKKKDAVK